VVRKRKVGAKENAEYPQPSLFFNKHLFNSVQLFYMTHNGHCSPTREERILKYVLKIEKGEKVDSAVIAKDLNIHTRKVGRVLSYLDCVERRFTHDRQHAIWVRV
jgi:hypothetical protein